MNKWLYDILKDNTLVDNQNYQVNDGVLNNNRLKEPLILNRIQQGQHKKHFNNEVDIWNFLNVSNREIKELLVNHKKEALVLFKDKDYEHNSEDNFIEVSGIDSRNFSLNTGNIIGYIKKGEYSLKISSRFGDNFLKHIISDADGFLEIENYGGSSKDDGYEWLLIYLWKTKLKKAYRLGLPKNYVTQNQNLSKVRGNVDVVNYFSNKHLGKYNCQYREHSYKNDATKLISATIKKIEKHEFLQDVTLIKNAFYTASEGQKINRRELFKTKHFSNPFYKEYNQVIDLSKLILKNELTDFGEKSENNAFFFDISMLFEYFVTKQLKKIGVVIESKFENRVDIATGIVGYRRKLEPDIVFYHQNKTFIFDVKYKNFDFICGVKREDLFQLHTYIGQFGNNTNIKATGFIYPISEFKWEKKGYDKNNCYIKNKISVMGKLVDFYIFFIKVPLDTSKSFHEDFKNNSIEFLNSIESIINL